MESLKNIDIKSEQVCRTCLIDEGHFFNISDTFDHYTLTQMIQNITNLQIHPTDGYTQFICEQCIQKLREAHTFRTKCLDSYNTLTKVEIKYVDVPISIKIDPPMIEKIKVEVQENCDIKEYILKSEVQVVESDEESDNRNDIKNTPKIIFDCPVCHGLFSNNNVYQKHINEFHSDKLVKEYFNKKCEPLGFIFKDKCSEKNKYLYKCALDEFTGNTFDEFRNHMKEHTGEKPVVCVDCGFRTSDIHLLKAHRIQKHIEEKKFSCALCNYTCQTKMSLKNHLNSHTREKNYKCELCTSDFKNSSSLSRHKKVKHEKRKSHICAICQKAFFHSTLLKNHILTHTGERPHVCQYCGKAFYTAEYMKKHVATQHDPMNTLFSCEICDYSTKYKSELKTHIKKHFNEKTFKCPQCPYISLLKSTLKLHIKRHSGEKPFSCDLCDYKCCTTYEIKQHKRTHTGEKPFLCTVCGYRGNTKEGLKRHMQTHSIEQKFECPNCPYKTNTKDTLKKHLRKNCDNKK